MKGLQALFYLLKNVYGIKNKKLKKKIKIKKLSDSIHFWQIFLVEIILRLFIIFSLRIKIYAQKPKSSARSI